MVMGDRQRDRRNRLDERLLVQSCFEDRLDTLVGDRVDCLGTTTRRLQPRGAVVSFQPQNPEAGAIALFGMPAAGQERGHHRCRGRPDALPPLDQAGGGPRQISLVRRREMRGDRGVSAALGTPHMARHTLALVETLDGRGREPDVQGPVHQGGRDAVVVALDLDMRIDIHPGRPPLGIDIRLGGQRLERWPVHRLELGLPTAGEFLEGAAIQPDQASGDRGVELRQTEEGVMPQAGQDPSFHQQDARFDFRLVPGFADPGRNYGDIVVLSERRIGRVQLRLIATGRGDAAA